MKTAAAVLGASLLFFLGVLTGVGRREAVPPPTAIPLGAANTPAASDTAGQPAPADPSTETTTTAATPSTPAPPSSTGGPGGSTGATVTTAASPAPTAPSTTTTRPGEVEQVDNQVNCRSEGKGKGKREPCPSTTTATGEAPGGGTNR